MSSAPQPAVVDPVRGRREAPGGPSRADRILFVTAELLDESFAHGTLRLARELRRRGKDVALLCGGGELTTAFRGIGADPVVCEALREPHRPLWLPRHVVRRVRAFRPQLVHLFGRALAPWGRKLSSVLGCPYVVTVMTLPAGRPGRLRGDWRRGSVLAISQELRAQLVHRGRVPKVAIGVVPFGIALDEYERFQARSDRDSTPVVGTVGPLTRERGGEVFLRAARALLDGGQDAHFLVAGDGPDRARLRRLVRRLDLQDTTTLVHDFSDYRRMLAVLDVCVFPGLQEGLSLNVVEAMACRKPVVATSTGAVQSVIADGVTGLLAPQGNPEALAEKVRRLLEDRALAERIAQAAADQVRERFSVQRSVELLLAFYATCLNRVEPA